MLQIYGPWLGAVVASALYILTVRDILKYGLKQNLATWGLWAALDLVTLISLIVQKGNWLVVASYVAGSTVVAVTLAFKKQFSWTAFETKMVLCVVLCLLAWYVLGPKAATWAGTISVVFATLPQLRESRTKPDRSTVLLWGGFTVVNLFFLLGAKSLEVKEVLFPTVCVVFCILLVHANLKRAPNN